MNYAENIDALLEQLSDPNNCNVLDYIDDAVEQIKRLVERAELAEQEVERLRDMIHAEKESRCMILPFSVGDTVFTNISVKGDRYLKSHRPYLATVVFVGIGVSETYFNLRYQNGRVLPFEIEEIGKTVFITREEAEKTLE